MSKLVHDADGNAYTLVGEGSKFEINGTVYTVIWENIQNYLQWVGVSGPDGREGSYEFCTDEKGVWSVRTHGGKKVSFREIEQPASTLPAECADLLAEINELLGR